ncbi:hypothetical protein ACQ86O_05975 [Serratia sp. L9]
MKEPSIGCRVITEHGKIQWVGMSTITDLAGQCSGDVGITRWRSTL